MVAGHSFGGMTAIRAAILNTKIKACLLNDPWLYVHSKEAIEGNLDIK